MKCWSGMKIGRTRWLKDSPSPFSVCTDASSFPFSSCGPKKNSNVAHITCLRPAVEALLYVIYLCYSICAIDSEKKAIPKKIQFHDPVPSPTDLCQGTVLFVDLRETLPTFLWPIGAGNVLIQVLPTSRRRRLLHWDGAQLEPLNTVVRASAPVGVGCSRKTIKEKSLAIMFVQIPMYYYMSVIYFFPSTFHNIPYMNHIYVCPTV